MKKRVCCTKQTEVCKRKGRREPRHVPAPSEEEEEGAGWAVRRACVWVSSVSMAGFALGLVALPLCKGAEKKEETAKYHALARL